MALSLVLSGCPEDFQGKISCSTNNDCTSKTGTLFSDASAPEFLPMCCSGQCVLPAGGCETGFRYLTNEPAYGECVAEDPMCPAPPDMAMEEEMPDMSSSD
jgi:hypothetical protein